MTFELHISERSQCINPLSTIRLQHEQFQPAEAPRVYC